MKNKHLPFLNNCFFKKNRVVFLVLFSRGKKRKVSWVEKGMILKSANLSVSLRRFLLNHLSYK